MKRCLLFILIMAITLSGCNGIRTQTEDKVETQEDKLQIGLSFDSFVIERWQRDRDVFVSTAKKYGAEVNVQNANGDLEEQISQLEYLINKKMDVIVIVCVDSDRLSDTVKKAKDAGIKVIAYDRMINNADVDVYISFDNEKVGELMANSLIVPGEKTEKVLMLCGPLSDNNVVLVEKGFRKVMEENDIAIIDTMYADGWKAELAASYIYENMDKVMQADGIMCGNDNIATTVLRALSEKQLAGKINIVGQDADLEACQRIVEGTQRMTVFKPVEKLAQTSAEYAVKLAKGETLSGLEVVENGEYTIPYLLLEPIAVKKENMDEIIISSGFHLREDVYLNVPQ